MIVQVEQSPEPERVRYREGQILASDDLTAEQEYRRALRERHYLAAHGWGIVCGLMPSVADVVLTDGCIADAVLTVAPGVAVDGYGRMLVLGAAAEFRLREAQADGKALLDVLLGDKLLVDIWLAYGESLGQAALRGHYPCGPGQETRVAEGPVVYFTSGETGQPPAWAPPEKGPTPEQWAAAPADPWPVFLGRITAVMPGRVSTAGRPYARLAGETITAPSRQAQIQLGTPIAGGGERFGVILAGADGRLGEPRLAIDNPGDATLRGKVRVLAEPDTQQQSQESSQAQAEADKQPPEYEEGAPPQPEEDTLPAEPEVVTQPTQCKEGTWPTKTEEKTQQGAVKPDAQGPKPRANTLSLGIAPPPTAETPPETQPAQRGPRAAPGAPSPAELRPENAPGLPPPPGAAQRRILAAHTTAAALERNAAERARKALAAANSAPAAATSSTVGVRGAAAAGRDARARSLAAVPAGSQPAAPPPTPDLCGAEQAATAALVQPGGIRFAAPLAADPTARPWHLYLAEVQPNPPPAGPAAQPYRDLRIEIRDPGDKGDRRRSQFVIGVRSDDTTFDACLTVRADGTVIIHKTTVLTVDGQVVEGPIQANPDDPRYAAVLQDQAARAATVLSSLTVDIQPLPATSDTVRFQYVVTNTGTDPVVGVRIWESVVLNSLRPRVRQVGDPFNLAPGKTGDPVHSEYKLESTDAGKLAIYGTAFGTAPQGLQAQGIGSLVTDVKPKQQSQA